MTAVLSKSFESIGDSRCARSKSQGCNATLKCCYTLFENILRGVGKSAVYVTRIGKTKACGGVFTVMEHIRSGCVNRYRTGISCGVGIFLTDMELQSFKFVIRHNRNFLSLLNVFVIGFINDDYKGTFVRNGNSL